MGVEEGVMGKISKYRNGTPRLLINVGRTRKEKFVIKDGLKGIDYLKIKGIGEVYGCPFLINFRCKKSNEARNLSVLQGGQESAWPQKA